jgi:hypothetical protein
MTDAERALLLDVAAYMIAVLREKSLPMTAERLKEQVAAVISAVERERAKGVL